MSGQSAGAEIHKDFEAVSHGGNEPLLPQRHNNGENEQQDDNAVRSGFYVNCDSVSVKSESQPEETIINRENLSLFEDTTVTRDGFPILNGVTGQDVRLPALPDDQRDVTEYSRLPLEEGNCDNIDIPLEVNAVLVELSGPDVITPPPSYTLIRGRRMRFLPQRMHFPTDSPTNFRYHPDFYRLHHQHIQRQNHDFAKNCCSSLMVAGSLNVRWFIIIISFIALCCVVVGIVLGALKGANEFTGDDSLTIALLLIGVGIILMTVSGIAWRLTAKQGSESSLRHMLGFGSMRRATSPPLQSFRQAASGPFSAYVLRNSFGRGCPGYYYEFQLRPPPPSYHASMTDYRVRTLFERNQPTRIPNNRTPPPGYRLRIDPSANPLPLLNQLHINDWLYQPATVQPRSAPPSYRSRTGDAPGRERSSLGQINTIFNENYATAGGYDSDGVTITRHVPADGADGETVAGRRYVDILPPPKGYLGSNIELLAQL